MLRPFLLSLIAFGAGGASSNEESRPADISTWRWQVSMILDAQRATNDMSPVASIAAMNRRYPRYDGGQPAAGSSER